MNSSRGILTLRLDRKLFPGRPFLALGLGLLMAFGAVSAQAATQPIEGTWDLGNGQVLVQAQPDGSFSGVVVEAITFGACVHPVGQQLWAISGSGLSYAGTHVWFHANCSDEPGGKSTWHITSTSSTKFTLTFCTAYPGDGSPDPSASPGHNVGATQCFALTRAVAPGQAPAAPANVTPPSISGSAAAGQTLTCSTGTWTNSPTAYDYSWSVDGTPVVGATAPTYKVPTLDKGLKIRCTVVAFNGGGAGTPATSAGVTVAVPVVAGCPRATGSLHGATLGLVKLDMTRAAARRAYTKSSDRGRRYEDFFCLTPIGVRVGYASPILLNTLPGRERKALAGRVIWASTFSGHYAVKGIRPGASLAAAKKALHPTRPFHIGLNTWYLVANGASTGVLKVRHGIVEEIGIGTRKLTQGRKAQRAFLKSFY
jgi:hypothetical protein